MSRRTLTENLTTLAWECKVDQEITGRDPTTRRPDTSEGEDPSSQVKDASRRGVDSLNVRLAVANNLDKLADRASEMADLVREYEEEGGGDFRVLETAGKTCKTMSETLHTIHGIFIVEAQRERGMDIEDFSSQVDRDR